MKKKKINKSERLEIRCSPEFKKLLCYLCNGSLDNPSHSELLEKALFNYARGGVYWSVNYSEEVQTYLYGEVIYPENR
jgi:hypothetical protein